jgi:glycosyltransferase involved in cell wall biosynthesis
LTRILVDIQGVQSRAHGERGIARYLTGLALELRKRHPELVSAFLLNPDLAIPGAIEPLVASARLAFSNELSVEDAEAFHVGSPIELDVELDRLWPPAARRLPLVVTLYDLIPEILAGLYLTDPGTRRRYRTRLELIKRADRILAISETTARDAIERLGLPRHRIAFVGAGVAEHFRRPTSRDHAVKALAERLPDVRPGFLLYTGGIDHRKNIDRLLVAYASLSRPLRDAHQLVIVCRVLPDERRALVARLTELGISQHVLLPGFVSDSDLVLLYQAADLFVFPSLYEGFGLPVAEAMACGAPVVAARTSSLVELVEDDAALFDPTRPSAIADAVRRALTDSDLRGRLGAHGLDSRWRWSEVADRTAAVYEEVRHLPRHRPRRARPRIAFVSPLPPQRSGVADYSRRLLRELVRLVDVDAFVDVRYGPSEAPRGVSLRRLHVFEQAEAARGGYDATVVCLGNSEHHAEALALLTRRPAVVLAHEVRLTGLYAWSALERPDLEPRSFWEALDSMYPDRLPPELGRSGWLNFPEYDRYGVLMAREAIARSTRYLVHSSYAATLARLEAAVDDTSKIAVVPFGFPDPTDSAPPRDALVATFGLVAPVKQTAKIVEAFALVAEQRPDAVLAVVGPSVSTEETKRIREAAARRGVSERVRVTGDLPPERFRSWLKRTTVAVELRATSNGESSASVADCLAAGVPTIATAVGSTRELPTNCIVGVDRDVSVVDLAAEITSLLDDPERRSRLSEAGRQHARANSFADAARGLVEAIFESKRLSRVAA